MTALRLIWIKKDMKNSFNLRLRMVEMSLERGVTTAASAFGTTRKTVYKWLKRYQPHGLEGLEERSRVPYHHPSPIPQSLVDAILAIRRQRPYLGPQRIQEEY